MADTQVMNTQKKKSMSYTTQALRDGLAEGKYLVAIRGQVYDLTGFEKVHPGGASRIRLSAGRDATIVFETTHEKSALKVLRKYHVGYLVDNQFPLFKPPNEFSQTLKKRVKDYFKTTGQDPKYSHDMIFNYIVPIVGIVYCYYLMYWDESIRSSWLKTLVLMIAWAWSYFGFTVTWVHDASHSSFTHNPKVWDAMAATYNFVMGHSDIFWFYKHVLGHHPYTNIVGVDPDISVDPFSIVRFLPSQEWYFFYEFQLAYGPVLYGALTQFLKYQEIRSYMEQSLDKIPMNPMTSNENLIFWGGKAFFYFYRCALPIMFSPSSTQRVLATFFISEMILSYMAGFVFEANHVVDDILWEKPVEGDDFMNIDWTQLQVETAQDYGHGNWLTTFLTGSLNYQVTHHIFPQIHQKYYPDIAPIVQATCKEYGLRYKVRPGFLEAFGDHLRLLKKFASPKTALN